MTMPRVRQSLEPIFVLPGGFRFDRSSAELQAIKGALYRGTPVALMPSGIIGKGDASSPEAYVYFFPIDGGEYLGLIRDLNKGFLHEEHGADVILLGHAASGAAEAIMDELAAGCEVHLIPEKMDGGCDLSSKYTLCRVPV